MTVHVRLYMYTNGPKNKTGNALIKAYASKRVLVYKSSVICQLNHVSIKTYNAIQRNGNLRLYPGVAMVS